MNPLIMIPARMAATRLPGKPLADIGGKPMIVRAWEQACLSGFRVAVAAGDEALRLPHARASVRRPGRSGRPDASLY